MNVKELRLKFGLSQQDLEDKTGIPKGRINGWEQSGSKPKAADTRILERFFNQLENKTSQEAKAETVPNSFLNVVNRLIDENKESHKETVETWKSRVSDLTGEVAWLRGKLDALIPQGGTEQHAH